MKGQQTVDLSWDGPAGANDVHVLRNGTATTTLDDRAFTGNIGIKVGGSYTYQVCEEGTSSCSPPQSVIF